MIIYIAPDDTKMYERTLAYAQQKKIKMLVVNKDLLIAAQPVGGTHPDFNSDSETVWIVGHGNEKEIGDKTNKGVTFTPTTMASFVISTLIVDGKKYKGSIVLDTCESGVFDEQRKTFADQVYDQISKQLPGATVGGWIGGASGPISGGKVTLTDEVFKQEEGFAWAYRKPPENQNHDVLAALA